MKTSKSKCKEQSHQQPPVTASPPTTTQPLKLLETLPLAS